ncbi:MAG: hypothetical protein V4772_26280, partial [Pseudomonadota bacterium]
RKIALQLLQLVHQGSPPMRSFSHSAFIFNTVTLTHRPLARQQLCSAVPNQKALDHFELELCLVLPHETLEVCPTSGVSSKPGRFTALAKQ